MVPTPRSTPIISSPGRRRGFFISTATQAHQRSASRVTVTWDTAYKTQGLVHANVADIMGQLDTLAFAAHDALAAVGAKGGSVVRAVGSGEFVVARVVLPSLDGTFQPVDGILGGFLAVFIQRRIQRQLGTLSHGEKHASGARFAGIEGFFEVLQCPIVGVPGTGGALPQ